MGVNSLPKTVTRQRRGCDLNPGPFAPESSTLTTRLPSHPTARNQQLKSEKKREKKTIKVKKGYDQKYKQQTVRGICVVNPEEETEGCSEKDLQKRTVLNLE